MEKKQKNHNKLEEFEFFAATVALRAILSSPRPEVLMEKKKLLGKDAEEKLPLICSYLDSFIDPIEAGYAFIKNEIAEKAIKRLIKPNILNIEQERVLLIPFEKDTDKFQMIFGYGDVIGLHRDLFLIWDKKKKTVSYAPFEIDEKLEKVPTWTKMVDRFPANFGLSRENLIKDFSKHRRVTYVNIEQIKFTIKNKKGFWRDNGFDAEMVCAKDYKKEFLLSPKVTQSDLKYIYCLLRILRNSFFVTLRDVFDERINIKLDNQQRAFGYDPYGTVRDFLRHIGVYPVKQGGSEERRRLQNDEISEIELYLNAEGLKITPKNLQIAAKECGFKILTPHIIKKIMSKLA